MLSLPFSITEGATVSNYTLSPAFPRLVRRKNGSENQQRKSSATELTYQVVRQEMAKRRCK